jgi:hypothetical protein
MSAIVRWGTERVCLEAIEIGVGPRAVSVAKPDPKIREKTIDVMIVARFTAKDTSAAFVGAGMTGSIREAAKCALVGP